MPEINEPAGQVPDAETPVGGAPEANAAAAALAKPRKERTAFSKEDQLKIKYRLDAPTNISVMGSVPGAAMGTAQKPLGWGPVLSPEVFTYFAGLDDTEDKRYLDWMLFQAGGGAKAMEKSVATWGDGTPEKTPETIYADFKAAFPNDRVTDTDINQVAQMKGNTKLSEISDQIIQAAGDGDLPTRFARVLDVIERRRIAKGEDAENLAQALVSFKFKVWIKREKKDLRVRDRVHALYAHSRWLHAVPTEKIEKGWSKDIRNRKREYVLGDQDAVKWDLFGFHRHLPGKDELYVKIHDELRQFLLNLDKVAMRNANIEQVNDRIVERNKSLPPDQQLALREPITVSADIGKVAQSKDSILTYRGKYPTLAELKTVNETLSNLTIRDRISSDVRYAGRTTRGPGEKLYSDDNLDVRVPLTLAASIKAGHKKWEISNPEQISDFSRNSMSAWTRQHSGVDIAGAVGQGEHNRKIPIMFQVKLPVPEDTAKILVLADILELQNFKMAPKTPCKSGNSDDTVFSELMAEWKDNLESSAYWELLDSFDYASSAIEEWGTDFDPNWIVSDPFSHYSPRPTDSRGLREHLRMRAQQLVGVLIE